MTDWITPKTNWQGRFENGYYIGDRFNLEDYNRLNNNLHYLQELSCVLYEDYNIKQETAKTYSDYLYAEDINTIEDNLEKINKQTFKQKLGDKKVFYPNGYFIDYNELNRLEKSMQLIYELLNNQLSDVRMLEFCFERSNGL